MKNIKRLLLTGLAITFLAGCKEPVVEEVKFEGLEIAEYPKTTFYCGENFTNNGITLTVKFSDGTSYVTEDVTTSKPSSMMIPGKQTIKAYYSNSEKDINAYVTYEINVIDWTREEKAIFDQTSLSSLSGTYYPKMDGMKLVTESDSTGITDYWIELENADKKVMNEYLDMLDEYLVEKTAVQDGEQYKITYKFYEQVDIPEDYLKLYRGQLKNAICFKYCASYEYLDLTGIYNLYASQVEDTLIVGLSSDNKLIVRFVANSILLETMLGCEAGERFTLNTLLNGTALEALKKNLLGYPADDGKHTLGYLDITDPLAVDYFIMPESSPEVAAIEDYCATRPWANGEDLFAFEIMVSATEEEYNDYISLLDAKDSFVKTTEEETYGANTYTYSVYTIENKPYVGNLEIKVSNFIPEKLQYTIDGVKKSVGAYYISYQIQAPEVLSPTVDELYRIYDIFYGEGNYSKENIQPYYKGMVDGSVRYTQFKETATHTAKDENEVENIQEAAEKFVAQALNGYTVKEALHEVTIQNAKVMSGTYENENFVVTIASYFSGNGKYTVEFTIEIKA